MHKFLLLASVLILSYTSPAMAQSFIVNDNLTPQQLIEDALFLNGTCEEITNIASGINGNVNGLISYGVFTNNSDFPLASGILIATGSAIAAANNPAPFVGEGNAITWGGSTDLEANLGIPNTVNATEISFEFTPLTENAQFRYVFSSDEYGDVNPQACTNRDAFAILIRPRGTTGAFTNIAILPDGSSVTVNNVHPQVNDDRGIAICPAKNDSLFDGIRSPSSRQFPEYNGRTHVLTTTPNSFVAGTTYEVKFVIADDTDRQRDSAAFIEVFQNNLELDITATNNLGTNLGTTNINTCSNSLTLSSVQNFPPSTTFQWFQDNVLLAGETNPTFTLSADAISLFTLEANLGTTSNGICTISQNINVTFTTNAILTPGSIQRCVPNGNTTVIDLSSLDNLILGGKLATGTVSYHSSEANAISNSSPLTAMYNATNGDFIYGRFAEASGCLNTRQLNINIVNGPELVNSRDASDSYTICDFNTDGFEGIDILELTNFYFPSLPPNTTLNYYTDPSRSVEYTGQAIASTTLTAVLTNENGCDSELNVRVIINIPEGSLPTLRDIEVCDDMDGMPRDGVASFDLMPNYNSVVAENIGLPNAIISLHSSLISAEMNNNIIIPSTSFRNQRAFTIEDEQTIGVRVEDPDGCTVFGSFILRPRYLLSTNSIIDLNQCDNIGLPDDGIAEFDFTNVNNSNESIENSFLGANASAHTLSIHFTQADALSGANPIDTSLPFINTTAPQQELFARVVDNATRCFDWQSFNLIVSEPVTVTPLTSVLEICDIDTDGIVNGLVTYFNNNVANVINADASLLFSYFNNANDAQNNTGALNNNSTNLLVDTNNEVFVRVLDPTTNCFEITSFEYFVNRAPMLGTVPPISVCFDGDINPSPIVDITRNFDTAVPPIIANNVTVTYYRTESQARAEIPIASDEITNETTFEITTNTNPSIWYRVIDNTTGCLSVVGQDFLINERPVIDPSILEIVECEIAPTDKIFDFILSTRDAELLHGQTEASVSYYNTLNDANRRINPIDKNSPFTNTSSPQTIAYRIERNNDSNCAITNEIDLKVGEFTAFNSPNVRQCDNDLTPGSTFELTSIIAEINFGATDTFTVSFHSSMSDAQANSNPLSDPSNPNEYTTDREIFDVVARVVNSEGCRRFPSFQFQTFPKPEISVQNFEICDLNQNGSETFDLVSGLSINSPLISFANSRLISSTSIHFFESNSVDSNGRYNDPILNPNSYSSTTPEKEIFIETETTQGCFFQTSVVLRVNPLPVFTTPTSEIIQICENTVGSGRFDIDLNNLIEISAHPNTDPNREFNILTDSRSVTNFSYAFFLQNTSNIPTAANLIPNGILNNVSNTDIFVQLTNADTGCVTFLPLSLQPKSLPIISAPSNPNICDTDGIPDGSINFSLNNFDEELLNGRLPTDFTVRYYNSTNTELTGLTTISNGETYTAEIIDTRTIPNCSNRVDFTLSIPTPPIAGTPNVSSLTVCDLDAVQNGTTAFDFRALLDSDILNGLPASEYTVTYHNSIANATSDPIVEISSLMEATSQTYVARLTNNTTNCFDTVDFNVVVHLLPRILNPDIRGCEDSTGSGIFTVDTAQLINDFEFFNLSDPEIENLTLRYFSDAAGTNSVTGTHASNDPLYVRAVNTRTSCETPIQRVDFIVDSLPSINAPNPSLLSICDEDGVLDGRTDFNFSTELDTEILGGSIPPNNTITYHDIAPTTFNESGLSNVNRATSQTYYARISNTISECFSVIPFDIIVNAIPEIEIPTTPLEACDTGNDNIETFDLTDIEDSFVSSTGAETNYTISYFRDASRTSQITSPTNFTTSILGLQNIYITLTSTTSSSCTFNSLFQIDLKRLPQINPIAILDFCAGETLATIGANGITRKQQLDQSILTTNVNRTVTYHSSIPTTLANEISLSTVLSSGNIYVKVLDTNTSCENTQQITLREVPLPIIYNANLTPQQLSACDTDGINDGNFNFAFDSLSSTILGTQNPSEYMVTYHSTLQDAEDAISLPINGLISSGEYFVKVIRNGISCAAIDRINIVINTLPENTLQQVTFCTNDPNRQIVSPNIGSNLTYLWQFKNDNGITVRPNEISESIQLSPNDIGVNVSLTITDINTANRCGTTQTVKVIESSSADIEMIVVKDFESEQITVNVTTSGDYLYGFNDPDIRNAQESNIFTNLIPGRFTIYVFDINGCEPASQVVDFINYYPGFTPNGSGPLETETWHIIGIESIPETLVYIYNRYGKLLKTLTSISSGWDGTYNGKPLPSDDYWILIRLEDGTEINDHITLKR